MRIVVLDLPQKPHAQAGQTLDLPELEAADMLRRGTAVLAADEPPVRAEPPAELPEPDLEPEPEPELASEPTALPAREDVAPDTRRTARQALRRAAKTSQRAAKKK